MDFFSNCLTLITGGSSGIGLALAKKFARLGSNVWILARRSDLLSSSLKIIESERISSQQSFGMIAADVSNSNQIISELNAFCNNVGTPDYLINSAGIVYPGEFINLNLDSLHSMMEINYFGTVNCIKAIIPFMISKSNGHIVNISSMAGFLGLYGYSGYSASKFAIRGFSDVLRSELKTHNIRVSVVFPPDTETPQLEFDNLHKPAITKELTSTGGLMQADDVAASIICGIQKKRYIITPGFEATFAYTLQSLTGNLVYNVMDLLVTQAQRKSEKRLD